MKNFKHYLVVAILSLPCLILAQEKNFADLAKSFKNPLEGKTFLFSKIRTFSEEVAASIRQDYPEKELPNPLKRDSLFSYKNGNLHHRECFKVEDGDKIRDNVRNTFLKDGTIYSIDSISTQLMNVSDTKNEFEYTALEIYDYISIFEKAKNLLSNKTLEIKKSKDSYIISWRENSERHQMTLDASTLFPSYYETRNENGTKIISYDISTKDSKIKIIMTSFNGRDGIFATRDITISESDSVKLNPEITEKDIGFRFVIDERGGIIRKYSVFNKVPDKKFLDELFKNPDDVQRYNTEIHRLAHPNEFLEN